MRATIAVPSLEVAMGISSTIPNSDGVAMGRLRTSNSAVLEAATRIYGLRGDGAIFLASIGHFVEGAPVGEHLIYICSVWR